VTEINPIKHIFWDWNGTLLDDAGICISSMNQMLDKRGMPLLSRERYQEVFTFPVIDYYRRIGWDFEQISWDEVAFEFIDLYLGKLDTAPLHGPALATLDYMKGKGYRQSILSAMEEQALLDSVRKKNIHRYFERIAGIGDHYAFSKIDIAVSLMNELNLDAKQVCLIGDTIHDLEVAQHLQCRCILVSGGHQSYERLLKQHKHVVKDLKLLQDIL
jgi:phosphoglycolate phosphatase